MNQYRRDIKKLYDRIVKIVSRGETFMRNYFDLIDEVIFYKQSILFEDVMYTKFGIDTKIYATVEDLKKDTFKKVSFQLETSPNIQLKKLFDNQNVYVLGSQFFDTETNKYLGDIKVFDTATISSSLNVTTFYSEYLRSAVPDFITQTQMQIDYKENVIVYYNGYLYRCKQEYIWNKSNQITPTFSTHWNQIYAGTYSSINISNPNLSLIEKYSEGINILRQYDFIENDTINYFVEIDYVEDYFE